MGKIGTWSTTPASNNQVVPNGWPEGMAPAAVNDCARQDKADIRTYCNTAEWLDWGDTPSRASSTTFKITGDVTGEYSAHRRIKCFDASTLYATIASSSYSAPDTTVTVVPDSGSLTASLSAVALAAIRPFNTSVPSTIGRKGADIASAATTDLNASSADFVDITGTTNISAFGTMAAGVEKTLRFTGALTLVYNATSLILPTATDLTTEANDVVTFRSLGSGNWICINYEKANGKSPADASGGSGIVNQLLFVSLTSTLNVAVTQGVFSDITGVTQKIVPASLNSRIMIKFTVCSNNSGSASKPLFRLVRDSTAIAIGDAAGNRIRSTIEGRNSSTQVMEEVSFTMVDTPSSTATVTYTLQCSGAQSGTIVVNRSTTDINSTSYCRGTTSLLLMEFLS